MIETFSRPGKESHVGTIQYEIHMLRFCADWLAQSSTNADQNEKNVYVECFLLHYRNLVQFFSGKGGSRGALRMTTPAMWSNRALTNEERKSIELPAVSLYSDFNSDISTYLAHCTRNRYERDKTWNVSAMMNRIQPVIAQFETLFPARTVQGHAPVAIAAEGELSTVGGSASKRARPL